MSQVIKRPPMVSASRNLAIEMFNNKDTLNLFSDASCDNYMFRAKDGIINGCSGSVAVWCDRIIDEDYRVCCEETVPAAEIRGIRISLSLALKYRYQFRVINLFCDSQIAVKSLRDFIYYWEYNWKKDTFYGATGRPAKNVSLILECFTMLQELRKTNVVNLFHQKGHVDSGWDNIVNAKYAFERLNGMYGTVTTDVIRFISVYNNYVDEKSRRILKATDFKNHHYSDAIEYLPFGGNIYERR